GFYVCLLPLARPPSAAPFPYTTLFRSVPDSNFASLANSGALQPAQWKTPRRCSVSRTEEHARSVEWPRRIAYCSGVNCFFHSASDRKSTRLNSSHVEISYAVSCLKKKT